jgi:hypothetical protein
LPLPPSIASITDYFLVRGFHRVALAMEHNLTEIPAAVSEVRLKRGPNTVKRD